MQDATSWSPEAGGPAYPGTVVHLVSEYWPYARSGGLAEAVRGIAHYQSLAGSATCVILPLYRGLRERWDLEPASDPFRVRLGELETEVRIHVHEVDEDEPRVFFVEHDGFFDREGLYGDAGGDYPDNPLRFGLYCRAALHWMKETSPGETLLHAHDWHTALAPVFLRTLLDEDPYSRSIPVVLTVHNAAFQGHYPPELIPFLGLPWDLYRPQRMEWYGRTNLLKGGLVFSDIVTTVSPNHAHELRTPDGGFGLHDTFAALKDRLVGILNGIDYDVWDPISDPDIEAHFEARDLAGKAADKAWLQKSTGLEVDPDLPLFGMTARLAQQKGFDILLRSGVVGEAGLQWVFLGEGESRYRDALQGLAEAHPDRVAAFFEFTEEREHRLLAAADFLLMPSQYEPCGLTQMRAQRYGALPVVRRVGGLADTVDDRVTGFVFDRYEAGDVAEAVHQAAELYQDREEWERWVRRAMARDFSWNASVDRYRGVYEAAARRRAAFLD
ncbi:MAG: glycogen/starch synthase [Gemmatimonadota bacterium]